MDKDVPYVSASAFLVIAKNDENKETPVAHFLAMALDEGEAIKMTREHLQPGSHVSGSNSESLASGSLISNRHYNQFTVKRVWACTPFADKELYIL